MITVFYWEEDDNHYTEVDYYPDENNRVALFRHLKNLVKPGWNYKSLDEQFSIMPRNLYQLHKVLDPSTDQELLTSILISKSVGNYTEVG
jgi:hypothetical protein